VIDSAERQLPSFARASQNVDTAAALLDTLPAPSADGVGDVYHRLRNILGTAMSYPVPRERERSLHTCAQDVQITRTVTI
jgi:hypothetical protein